MATQLNISVAEPILLVPFLGSTQVQTADPNITLGQYHYHAASKYEDTANDWRMYADENGFYFQFCTVGDSIKGNGTWVTKFTIQV